MIKKGIFEMYVTMLLSVLLMNCSNINEYYVSEDGDDSGDGTITAPFATIEKALEVIKKENGRPHTVVLREGTYLLNNSLIFNKELSGSEKKPLTIKAFEGEKVVISGGRYFNGEALETPLYHELERIINEDTRKKLKVIDLKKHGITDYGQIKHTGFSRPILPSGMELFQGDKNMTLASYPSEGYIKISEVIDSGSKPRNEDFTNRGGIFKYDSQRASRWSNTNDLWVQGMFGTVWADDKLKVAAIDTVNKKITTEKPYLYGITGGHFRFINVFEEINKPGDYFIDRQNGKVYLYPFNTEEAISVTLLETPLISIMGASNVQFMDIIFENGRGLGA